jgi:small nuclear ribonucleoprotein (snRNP)-like protein
MDRPYNSNKSVTGDEPKTMEADAKIRRMLQYIGEKVNVKTIFGSDFQGVFMGYDNHMNVILSDATEMRYKFIRHYVNNHNEDYQTVKNPTRQLSDTG